MENKLSHKEWWAKWFQEQKRRLIEFVVFQTFWIICGFITFFSYATEHYVLADFWLALGFGSLAINLGPDAPWNQSLEVGFSVSLDLRTKLSRTWRLMLVVFLVTLVLNPFAYQIIKYFHFHH